MIEFHPVADIFPLMEAAEFETLVDDVRKHGLADKIAIYEDKMSMAATGTVSWRRWPYNETISIRPRWPSPAAAWMHIALAGHAGKRCTGFLAHPRHGVAARAGSHSMSSCTPPRGVGIAHLRTDQHA
jgi:hypothetical protein